MERILSEAEGMAEAQRQSGGGRERALDIVRQFGASGDLAMRTFGGEEREGFLSIACLENDQTRELTEGGPRTIGVVASRVRTRYGSFRGVASTEPILGRLDPAWFQKCAEIEEEGFDWTKMQRPWLVPACQSEKRESPDTQYYVWEGVHSSLVLAFGLMTGSLSWQPLEAIVSLRRPEPGC